MLPLIKSDVAFKSIISVITWRFNTRKNVDTYTYYFCYSIWIHSLIPVSYTHLTLPTISDV